MLESWFFYIRENIYLKQALTLVLSKCNEVCTTWGSANLILSFGYQVHHQYFHNGLLLIPVI